MEVIFDHLSLTQAQGVIFRYLGLFLINEFSKKQGEMENDLRDSYLNLFFA